MTFTPCDLAFAAIAAPEPESRLTSSSTLAPLVIACSACCCCVDLSPSAFWISDSTPALSNASFRNGRSTVSQRTDDLESGSRTATLPGLSPPPPLPLLLEPPESSSPPQPATASAHPVATIAASHAPLRMEFLLLIGLYLLLLQQSPRLPPSGEAGDRARPRRGRARWRRAPRRGRRASRRRPGPPGRPWGARTVPATRGRRRAAARPRPRGRRRRSAAPG